MRKIFTRLISIFVLSTVFVIQGFAQAPTLTPGPDSDFANHEKSEHVVFTVSEEVVAGVGVVRFVDGGTTVAAYQATNSNVAITGNDDDGYEIAIDFTGFMVEEAAYAVEFDADFVMSTADVPVGNLVTNFAVTTGDYTAPMLADDPFMPENGENEGIQLDDVLMVTFDENVAVAADAMIYIYTDNGTPHGDLFDVASGGALSVAGMTVTITPSKDFVGSTTYYVVIPDSTINDVSVNENAFVGWTNNTTWAFTVRDTEAPEVTTIAADNVTGDEMDIVLQLDKSGMVAVAAVLKDAPAPGIGDFPATVEVEAADTDVTLSIDGLTDDTEYDIYVYAENMEVPTNSDITKELTTATADITAPMVASYYPMSGEGASDVNEMDYMAIEIDEMNDVMIGTGSVTVYTWDAGLNHEMLVSVPAASCMLNEDMDSLFIPVDNSLWVSEATYFVHYDEGLVTDETGNELAGVSTTEAWQFTIQDILAPTYTTVPENGTMDADETAPQMVITFNEPIFWDDDSDEDTPSVPVTAGNVVDFTAAAFILTKDAKVATYTPSIAGNVISMVIDDVMSNYAFELSIDNAKISDANDNVGTGVDVIAFTIVDFAGPVATIKPPMPGQTDNIMVEWDEKVYNDDGSDVTDTDVENMIIFRKGDSDAGDLVAATYSVAADGMSFIINPDADFTTPGDEYYVKIGPSAVVDAVGNPNDEKIEILVIDDFVPPTAEFTGIGDSPVATPVNAVIEFSEAMQTLDGNPVSGDATALVTVKEDGENVAFSAAWNIANVDMPTIVISPIGNSDKTYTISVGKSLEDLAGNPFDGISTTFTSMSDVGPAMVSVTPEEDAMEQANDVAIEVTFDMDIAIAAGGVTISRDGGPGVPATATVDGAVLKINNAGLAANEMVTVTVPAGAVEGAVNAEVSTEAVTWTFYTKDTEAPQFAGGYPAPGGIMANVMDSLVLMFDEEVELKTGQFQIKNADTDVTVQNLTEANAELVVDDMDNQMLVIKTTGALDYDQGYYVVVTPGVVADLAGNDFAGFSGTTWNFTTVDNPGSFDYVSSDPEFGQEKVDGSAYTTFTVQYNRDIAATSATARIGLTVQDEGGSPTWVFLDASNTSRFSTSGNTLTIDLLSDALEVDKQYTIWIYAGALADEFGTENAQKFIPFYTFDKSAPVVASHTPQADAEDVALNTTISVTWDEMPFNSPAGTAITAADIKTNALVSVDNGIGTNFTAGVSGMTWTIALDAELAEETMYTVTVDLSKVQDENDRAGAGTYTWSFTTLDATCNAPTAFMITDNTTGSEIDFTVDFDEAGMVYYVVQDADATAPTAAEIMAADNTIEFDAAGTSDDETVSDLMSGDEYKAYFVAVDASANESSVYEADMFATADVVKPMLVDWVPATDSVGVDANTELVLTYDEDIQLGMGTVVIREVATDVVAATITLAAANTTIEDETATIDGGLSLGNETEYYLEVSTGAFTDMSGNEADGISGMETWTFTTKDIIAPMLVATYPKADSIPTPEIPAGTMLSMEFDEPMVIEGGVVYVKYTASGDVFEVVNADALTQSDDMMTITFGLTNVPAEQAEFMVDLTALVLTDEAENPWDNTVPVSWKFVILDETPPALAMSAPEDGEDEAPIATDVYLEFTEKIYSAGDGKAFTDETIADVVSLVDADGEAVEATYAIVNDMEVTITPDEDLMSESTYTVNISPVVDEKGNISSDMTVMFTTADETAPTVMWDPKYDTSENPNTGVITVTWSEPVVDEVLITSEGNKVIVEITDAAVATFFTYNMVTITRDVDGDIVEPATVVSPVVFTGTISADKMTMILTPDADEVPLGSEAWYEVMLKDDVVMDLAGNANAADNTIFQIEDNVAPEATAYSPEGATDPDEDMMITFDEYVALGTGNIYIRNLMNGEIVETIAVDATNVEIDEMEATIAHADFPEAMYFFVTADAGVFTDTSSNANPWEGIATDVIDEWNFSTADATAPVVAVDGLNPAPAAVNVALNKKLQITFDKVIELNDDGETRYVIIYNEDWTPYEAIEAIPANMTIGATTGGDIQYPNRVLTINNMELMPNSMYYVRVMPGTVTDVPGNEFAGIMDDTWSFATEDNMAPSIVAVTPEDDATLVDPRADLMIEFDRNVLPSAVGMVKLYKEQPGEELGTLIETIDPTSASVTIEGKMATMKLAAAMEEETGYYVIVEAGSFTNTGSERLPLFPGIITTQGWNFVTGIGSPVGPVVTTLSPNAETIADNHPTMVVTFEENVVFGDDGTNLYVTKVGEEVAHLTIPITADMVTDNVLTVTYEYDAAIGGLEVNTEYFITVDSAAVKNVEEVLAWEGIKSTTEWTFTTGADFATGIEDLDTAEFNVYPNPFSSFIRISNNEKLVRVVVSNIAGQRVIDVDYPENEIRTDNLVSGIYVVSLITEDGIAKTEKIIKK